MGATPRRVQQARTALQRPLHKLCALIPQYAGLEPGGTHDGLAPLESLRRLHATLAGKVRATLRAKDQGRLHEWRAWLEEAWISDQGVVYR